MSTRDVYLPDSSRRFLFWANSTAGRSGKVGTHHKCVLGIKCSDLSVINTVEPRKILASIGALILEQRTRK